MFKKVNFYNQNKIIKKLSIMVLIKLKFDLKFLNYEH